MSSWGLWKYIETKLRNTCFYLAESFSEKQRRLELVSLPHFRYDFWRKRIMLLYFIAWPNSIVWFHWSREILGNMCIVIVSLPGCDSIIFEINFIFLSKPFFLHDQKVRKKKSWERKELLRSNKKHFSSLLKGFHWSK